MVRVIVFFLIFWIFAEIESKKDSEADFRKLPKLFHLDDYERCLERRDGLYCLGQFQIYSDVQPNPLYDLIQGKSQNERLFNRSHLYRGYCLPTRCPGGEANATARFERCVDDTVRRRSLRARIHTLHYCRARGERLPGHDTHDIPHTVFLYIVYIILFMNALGTVYDLKMGPTNDRNKITEFFSIRANWKKLTKSYDNDDTQILRTFNGMKAILLIGAVVAHVGIINCQAWHDNPRVTEKSMLSPLGLMIGALTTSTQLFVLISNFLTTHTLLLLSKKMKISFRLIPFFFFKRLLRILPIYLLMNGFSATWWNAFGEGPVWPVTVGIESRFCREKFWPQAFFLQHLFEPHKTCLLQTWVVAVDVHLYGPSLVITIWLMKHRKRAKDILLGLLAAATAVTTYVALKNRFIPAFYFSTPEVFRELFASIKSHYEFFITPFNCLIFMVIGILLAFLYDDIQNQSSHKDTKEKPANALCIAFHYLSIPMVFVWSYVCTLFIPIKDPLFMSLMIPIERLTHGFWLFMLIYTSLKMKSFITDILAWDGLRVPSRLSMSISMVHWCINKTLVANQTTLLDASQGTMLLSIIGVAVISFVLAIPMTLLVEYPMSKIMDKPLSYLL